MSGRKIRRVRIKPALVERPSLMHQALRPSRRFARLSAALLASVALAGCAGGSAEQSSAAAPAAAQGIPVPARAQAEAPAVAPAQPVAAAPAPAYTPPAPVQTPPPAPSALSHVVAPGDTVYSLGRRYGVTPQQIQAANNLDAAFTIRIGQTLNIPGGGAPVQPVAAPAQPVAAQPAPVASATPPSSGAQPMISPVDGPIVGVFGQTAGSAPNAGVDIAAPAGSTVRAAATGTVIYVSAPHPTVGSVVLVEHGGGMRTVYGLVEQITVQVGQQVQQGAPLAVVAQPSNGNQPMLHFEIRRGSEPVDPTPYIRGAGPLG